MMSAALLACALNVSPVTMGKIIDVESGGIELALHVNKLSGQQPKPATKEEAAAVIRKFVAAGFSVDIGYSQINSANLSRLGYTVEDALDPCKNIAGGAVILHGFYTRAVQQYGEGQTALKAALRAYNTGSFYRGDAYLARYYINAPLPDNQPMRHTATPPATATTTTVAYDRPGLDLKIN